MSFMRTLVVLGLYVVASPIGQITARMFFSGSLGSNAVFFANLI